MRLARLLRSFGNFDRDGLLFALTDQFDFKFSSHTLLQYCSFQYRELFSRFAIDVGDKVISRDTCFERGRTDHDLSHDQTRLALRQAA